MANRTTLVADFYGKKAKPIPGYPGYYVSPSGEVFSVCRLSPCLHNDGYVRVVTFAERRRRRPGVHVLVALAFLPKPRKEQREVRHWDGSKTNNHFKNLKWGTRKENAQDMVRHGRSLKGHKNHKTILTAYQVRQIRASRSSPKVLAKRYKVCRGTIHAVQSRRNWKYI